MNRASADARPLPPIPITPPRRLPRPTGTNKRAPHPNCHLLPQVIFRGLSGKMAMYMGVYDRAGGRTLNGAPVYIKLLGERQARILSRSQTGRWTVTSLLRGMFNPDGTLIAIASSRPADNPLDSGIVWRCSYRKGGYHIDDAVTCKAAA